MEDRRLVHNMKNYIVTLFIENSYIGLMYYAYKAYNYTFYLVRGAQLGHSTTGLRPSSVRRPSTFCFKRHLLLNRLANFDKTLQGCSLRGPLLKLFKELDFSWNYGCHGNGEEKLKKSSSPKLLDEFQNVLAQMFLGCLSTKIVQIIWIRKKHGCQGRG